MQPLTIINDVHIGAQRSAGTTPLTAWQLRQYLLEEFQCMVEGAESELCILGDLFDSGSIPMADVLATWEILREHLQQGKDLILVAGNHDLAKNLTTLSSFQFLCKLLSTEFPDLVDVVDQPCFMARWDAYIIPHLPNQDLFDQALAEVPTCTTLMVHCNYENKFAVESDHSLNLSTEQAMKLPVKHILFAHEHQARTGLGGKVIIAGNQIPSSIADCLGNSEKFLTLVWPDLSPQKEAIWKAEGNYAEKDWRNLQDGTEKFIRVVGEASADEAADVVTAISKFRIRSKALVITNAVKVEGAADGAQIQLSMEEVKSFNVLEALLECLDEREQGVVKSLLNREAV